MLRLLLACAVVGLTFGWPRITIPKGSATASGSRTKWTPTHPDRVRRLEGNFVETHSDRNDPDCIVGGYDTDNPLMVYVGGPCSGLTVDGDDVSPNDDFRWMVMMTVHIDITDGNNSAPMDIIEGSEVIVGTEFDTHAEIAVGASMAVNESSMDHAAVYACTTSYVAKDTIHYNTNSFAIGENETDRIEQCVAPCCSDPGDDGCECTDGCPDTMLEATAGMFKYSIMAASYNEYNATAGASGNGWERVVEEIGEEGENGSKEIFGFMDVYQLIDFTNMSSDTLTITSSSGSITYSSMGTCDLNTGAGCDDNAVEVESMTVESGTWTGQYAFPQTYNFGSWALAEMAINTTVEGTKKVLIMCVKPDPASMGMHPDAKVVLLRYRFDISGITADETSGKFVNYDPIVTSDDSVTTTADDTTTGLGETTTTLAPADSGTDDGSGDGADNSGDGSDGNGAQPVDASSAWGMAPGGLLALTMGLVSA